MAKIQEFKRYNTFLSLLLKTKKYKELYSEHCAWIAFAFTFIFSLILIYIFDTNRIIFFENIKNLLLTFSSGMLGLLGVYITGLALMITVISDDSLKILEKNDKIESLVGILYCFYFAGAIILLTIVDFIMCYFLILTNIPVPSIVIYFLISISNFLFFYSLSYTVALLGTCINIFIANKILKYFKNFTISTYHITVKFLLI